MLSTFVKTVWGKKSAIRCMMCQKVSKVNELYQPSKGNKKPKLQKSKKSALLKHRCLSVPTSIISEKEKKLGRRSRCVSLDGKRGGAPKIPPSEIGRPNVETENPKNNHHLLLGNLKRTNREEISACIAEPEKFKRTTEKDVVGWKERFKDLKVSYDKEMHSLKNNHRAELKKLSAANEEMIRLAKDEASCLNQSYKMKLIDRSKLHEGEIAKLEASHLEDVGNLK